MNCVQLPIHRKSTKISRKFPSLTPSHTPSSLLNQPFILFIIQFNCNMTDFVYQGEDFDEKVRKQVEFYFSDSNLQTDKFYGRFMKVMMDGLN